MRTTVLSLLALLLTLTSCDDFGPGARLSHAAAMLQCGPADEPFTAIVLSHEPITSSQPAYPVVYFTIHESVLVLAGRRWDVTSDSVDAGYANKPGKTERPLSGHITIQSVDAANTVTGAVSVRFPSRVVDAPFTAPWLNTGRLCP